MALSPRIATRARGRGLCCTKQRRAVPVEECCPIPGAAASASIHATFDSSIAPFVISIQTANASFGPDGPGAFFFLAPINGGETIEAQIPTFPINAALARFCFCTTWRQVTPIPADSVSFVGLGSILAGMFFAIAANPSVSNNYVIQATGSPAHDTGIPFNDGIDHAWRVCVESGNVSFSVDGGPLTPAPLVVPPAAPLPPFILVNEAGGGVDNRIRISDYCAARV